MPFPTVGGARRADARRKRRALRAARRRARLAPRALWSPAPVPRRGRPAARGPCRWGGVLPHAALAALSARRRATPALSVRRRAGRAAIGTLFLGRRSPNPVLAQSR